MEDLLRAVVVDHGSSTAGTQLVVATTSRVIGPFASLDMLVAWSGGLRQLYEELQLRFPLAAAIGVSAQLAAVRPFPFASGWAVTTMCVVTAAASAPAAHVVESVVLGIRTPGVLVDVLTPEGTACPIFCLERATSEHFPHMLHAHDVQLSSLSCVRTVPPSMFQHCHSLQSVCFTNLPLLESIGELACYGLVQLRNVYLSDLPSLRSIGECAFNKCASLLSVTLVNLPLLETVGDSAFSECVQLPTVDLSGLPSLRSIKNCAFSECESLQSVCLANLLLLESIGDYAFNRCFHLSNLGICGLPSLRDIGRYAFKECASLQSISLTNLPRLRRIGDYAFYGCVCLSHVDLSGLPSLDNIGVDAFNGMLQQGRNEN